MGRALVTPQRLPDPALVGRPAVEVARKAGLSVPPGTRVLVAPLAGVGRDYPLSIEKLCPVLAFYVVARLAGGLRALQADPRLRRDGPHDGHPLARRGGDPRVRPQEAGVPHRREHAHRARVDRHDDGAGPGADAGLRRLRRQHHVGQHLAAAPAQREAARLGGGAGRRPPDAARRRRCPGPRPRRPRPGVFPPPSPADTWIGFRARAAPEAGGAGARQARRISCARPTSGTRSGRGGPSSWAGGQSSRPPPGTSATASSSTRARAGLRRRSVRDFDRLAGQVILLTAVTGEFAPLSRWQTTGAPTPAGVPQGDRRARRRAGGRPPLRSTL